jgi:hypothetical protein
MCMNAECRAAGLVGLVRWALGSAVSVSTAVLLSSELFSC